MSNTMKKKLEFFRRVLPDDCISFYSEEGKLIFAEALATGHMNCYFKLAAQFRTQDEPAFCGLSTLVMILNALDVDPGVVWKGPWRWYHENMLDCCIPLNVIKSEGINLEQFSCIAECNSLLTTCVRPGPGSEDSLRQVINEFSEHDDSFIVATYSRKVLKQTGDGHFSPIAGFHPERDLVLIMDTARFKYPPHWIKVSLLLKAMNALDESTGLPRGYIILKKKDNSRPLILFRVSTSLSMSLHDCTPVEILTFLKKWSSYLQEETNIEDNQESIMHKAVGELLSFALELKPEDQLLETQTLATCCPCEVTHQYRCVVDELLQQLKKLQIFSTVEQQLKMKNVEKLTEPPNPVCANSEISTQQNICGIPIDNRYIFTMLLLSWPFCCSGRMVSSCQEQNQPTPIGKVLHDVLSQQLQSAAQPLLNEVNGLNRQLSSMNSVNATIHLLLPLIHEKVLNKREMDTFHLLQAFILVLIMDTARFKYPPYWIKVSLLLKAMNALDESTGLPPSYIILKKKDNSLIKNFHQFTAEPCDCTPVEILTFVKKNKCSYSGEETNTEDN